MATCSSNRKRFKAKATGPIEVPLCICALSHILSETHASHNLQKIVKSARKLLLAT